MIAATCSFIMIVHACMVIIIIGRTLSTAAITLHKLNVHVLNKGEACMPNNHPIKVMAQPQKGVDQTV